MTISAPWSRNLRKSYADAASTITGTLYPIHTTLNVIAINSRILGDKAKGDGIRIISPWEWLGQSGMVRYLESQGANLDELKAKVDQIEKS